MTSPRARSLPLLALLALLAAAAGCAPSVIFYDVTRTSTRDCDIFPNDSFCAESEDLPPPVTETWSVELIEPRTFVYADGDVWVAEGIDGDRTVVKRAVITRDPGPCTTTTERRLSFSEDGVALGGTLEETIRVEGPEACGDTPRGESHAYLLTGQAKDAP